jgi:hypothetical protein
MTLKRVAAQNERIAQEKYALLGLDELKDKKPNVVSITPKYCPQQGFKIYVAQSHRHSLPYTAALKKTPLVLNSGMHDSRTSFLTGAGFFSRKFLRSEIPLAFHLEATSPLIQVPMFSKRQRVVCRKKEKRRGNWHKRKPQRTDAILSQL